jgi:hypothetical protein
MGRPSRRVALRWAAGLLLLVDSSSTAVASTGRSFAGALPSATAATSPAGSDRAVPHANLAALARTRLDRHIDAPALTAWRDTCRAAEARAFDFLFAWLPSADLAAWRADRVIADIGLALTTRAAAPWGDLVD